MTSQSKLTVYTFQMLDCYGDNFTYSVKSSTEKEARSIAEMACDDASTGKLLKQTKITAYEARAAQENNNTR